MTIAQTVIAYDKRVEKGIAWLNKNKPGWSKIIKLEKLDLSETEVCILGQAYKNFWNAIIEDDGGEGTQGILTQAQAKKLGFMESGVDGNESNNYDLLTTIWFEKIKCLRQ